MNEPGSGLVRSGRPRGVTGDGAIVTINPEGPAVNDNAASAPDAAPAVNGQPPTASRDEPADAGQPKNEAGGQPRASSEQPRPHHDRQLGTSGQAILVRHTGLDQSFGLLAVASPSDGVERRASQLHCDRLSFAVDRGVCLTIDRAYTSRQIIIFDAQFRILFRLPLAGLPSRVRLSPDGRLAATTSFVTGHSYGDDIFSTATNIIDTHTGQPLIGSLQDLEITRNGTRFQEIDFNVWGVTFAADSDRFYATLGTGGKALLLEGRVSARRMAVVYEGVECPSLSPDGQRIVFKKKVARDNAVTWQLTALQLTSLTETALTETRSIDDQVEWLDVNTVLYGVPRQPGSPVTDVWRSRADGTGRPSIFLPDAASPSVQRGE